MFRLALSFGLVIIHVAGNYIDRFDDELSSDHDEFRLDLTYKQTYYDLLVISQTWPQTACWSLNRKWTNSTSTCSPCNMPESKHDWTIHGLWPSNSKGKHPFNCNKNIKFNIKLLNKALVAQMEEKWPSFNLNTKNELFWKHEWDKHGTCALNLSSTNTLPKYFSKSIQLLEQYNVGKILAEDRILPGKMYDYEDIVFVIEKKLRVKAVISCANHPMSKQSYLSDIEVCLDKTFELIDCPASRTRCKGKVLYPEPRQECSRI